MMALGSLRGDRRLAWTARAAIPPLVSRPAPPIEAPPISRVQPTQTRLVLASKGLLAPLRHAGCADLDLCEEQWIELHGEAPAQCPGTCEGYRPRGGAR